MTVVIDEILNLLSEKGIFLVSPIPLSDCDITRRYLLERSGICENCATAVMMAVPYRSTDLEESNISEYAKSRDYHLFFSRLFDEILPRLRERFPSYIFEGFNDHSPIGEVKAAAAAGIGIIGENGLLITERYSSFVFLGEIITDAPIECEAGEIGYCEGCMLCKTACPVGCDKLRCISALTQKKGELTAGEEISIRSVGSAWGCDICQNVCPHTKAAIRKGSIYTPISFFKEARLPFLTKDLIASMGDGEFKERAYAWRGRGVLLRNLELFEKKQGKE